MTITYKTEGKCILTPSRMSKEGAEVVAVTWTNGDDIIYLHQGGNTIKMSKKQLLELSDNADSIADNIQPHMNSLPRPA